MYGIVIWDRKYYQAAGRFINISGLSAYSVNVTTVKIT